MTSDLPPVQMMPDSPDSVVNTEYDTEYEIGQDNIEVLGLNIHNPVFFMSAGLVIFFSVVSLVFPEATNLALADAKTWTLQSADWLFAVTPVIVFLFSLSLAISPLGRIRLGGLLARRPPSGWHSARPFSIGGWRHGRSTRLSACHWASLRTIRGCRSASGQPSIPCWEIVSGGGRGISLTCLPSYRRYSAWRRRLALARPRQRAACPTCSDSSKRA